MWGVFSSGGTVGYLLRLVVQPLAALDILGHDTKLSNAWVCVCLRKHLKKVLVWMMQLCKCAQVEQTRATEEPVQFPLRVHLTRRGGASCCGDPFTIKIKNYYSNTWVAVVLGLSTEDWLHLQTEKRGYTCNLYLPGTYMYPNAGRHGSHGN